MVALPPGQVHIWITQPEVIQDNALLADYLDLLSTEEREKQKRFHFERDRKNYLCTRALVRAVLSKYAPVAPAGWEFERNAYDKPEIKRTDRSLPDLQFNLSHSNQLIACAVTLDRKLGIDVEHTIRSTDFPEVANRYFSSLEMADLNRLSIPEREMKFFEYWTLKEAYIKACGEGLQIPLDVFSMNLTQQGKVAISFTGNRVDNPEHWQFQLYRLHRDHYLSLAVETPLTPDSVLLFEGIPLREFTPADYRLMRSS